MNDDEKYKDIVRRLQILESHIVNLIIPLQGIDKLITDDKYRAEMLKTLQYLSCNKLQVNESPFNRMRADLERLSDKIDKISSMELGQTLSEIKYIGNRLNEVEKVLKKVDNEGISKKVELQFSVDGYELVKKPVDYQPEMIEKSRYDRVNEALEVLNPRGKKAVIHRLGLIGNKPCTFKKISEMIGLSYTSTRQLYRASIRCLRNKENVEKVRSCEDDRLKQEVLGTCINRI